MQSATSQSLPQSAHQKVTFTCQGKPFQDVIRQLEAQTGVHFVYSTNKIQISKLVTLNVTGKSLEDVLILLANQTNLVFKKKDQYVVIKTADATLVKTHQLNQPVKPHQQPITKSEPERIFFGPEYNLTGEPSFMPDTKNLVQYPNDLVGKDYLNMNYKAFSLYFDTMRLPGLSKQRPYIQKLNLRNNHRHWFISSGVVANNFTAGAEFQGGLRSIYMIFSPGWLKDKRYHGAYGIGTSIPLERNISLNLAYSYAQMKYKPKEETQVRWILTKEDLTSVATHQQVKVMIQYAFTKNINLRIGPTLNRMLTTYYLPEPERLIKGQSIPATGSPDASGSFNYRLLRTRAPAPQSFQDLRLWINWETTLSYKFNFYKR